MGVVLGEGILEEVRVNNIHKDDLTVMQERDARVDFRGWRVWGHLL